MVLGLPPVAPSLSLRLFQTVSLLQVVVLAVYNSVPPTATTYGELAG